MSNGDDTRRVSAGDGESPPDTGALIEQLYDEMRRLARRRMAHQDAGHTLGATALLNEALLRILGSSNEPNFRDREHLLATAARAMRSVLVDHARRKGRQKRTGRVEDVPLEGIAGIFEDRALDLLALDEALGQLASFDVDLAHVVELRFFGGLDMDDVARVRGCSRRTAERNFAAARAWLRGEMDGKNGE